MLLSSLQTEGGVEQEPSKTFILERQFCIVNAKIQLTRDTALPCFERMIQASQIAVAGFEATDLRGVSITLRPAKRKALIGTATYTYLSSSATGSQLHQELQSSQMLPAFAQSCCPKMLLRTANKICHLGAPLRAVLAAMVPCKCGCT